MNLRPSGIGAEPKKLAILGVVLAVAAGVYWMNRSDIPAGASVSPEPIAKTGKTQATLPSAPAASSARPAAASYGPRTARGGRVAASGDDFRPTLKPPEGLDLTRVDPTLKTDLLARVRQVSVEASSRSLFEFYTPPPPPPPQVAAIKPAEPAKTETKADGKPPAPPPPPPPPPIPLKFYGYSGSVRSTARKAFFLDGEDIVQAGENETIRNRYKILRIGVNSAEVEDTVAKNKQTLPLAEEAP